MANNLTENEYIDLPISLCALIDIPMPNGIDCSALNQNQSECIRCIFTSRYFTNEKLNDTGSLSHIISIIIWLITLIIGMFATCGNIIIIAVLRLRNSKKAFDTFLMSLAIYDISCCVFSMYAATTSVIYLQNWNRGLVTFYILIYSVPLAILARSGSSFMTVIITIERYLVVAYPLKFCRWFTTRRTRLITIFVLLWSVSMGIPRLSSVVIVPNNIGQRNFQSIQFLDYIVVSTPVEKFWYLTLGGFFDIIDYWAPLPFLLFFNAVVYYHIRKHSARRRQLTQNHQTDIRAARMFLPVVVVLFLCNIEPIIHYYFVFNRIFYRELGMGVLLFFTVNSAVNLPIYYFGGSTFRKETRGLIASWLKYFDEQKININQGSTSTPRTSTTGFREI